MKKLITLFVSLLILTSCSSSSEKLLLAGSGWNKLVIIDKESKQIEWEYPLNAGWECNSVDMDKAGNILFSYSKGAQLITKDKKVLWDIPAPENCELQTAKVLPDGNYLLAWCGNPASIMEVDSKGTISSQIFFDTKIDVPHAQFRQVNKNNKGNYLIPLFQSSDLWEISPSANVVKQIPLEGTPFCTALLPNGNYLVACGDAHSYVELDIEGGDVVKEVQANDIEGISLRFVAQLLPTKQGGLFLCNWQGHGTDPDFPDNPQLVELDNQGNIVWSLNDNATFGMISTVCVVK
ncbi:hypothetical protein [Massilibacteroides sp.]|uniref:beta-propeller domain-containing protein n=1 Tax=Massilibacteroides sp. TaxID=2034766 RepID=UPI002637EE0B|nr:hypothetical protein [Massilibacteroides sp.]MDD4516558.1 hypothetical protein [Massilibacteroides sp.]